MIWVLALWPLILLAVLVHWLRADPKKSENLEPNRLLRWRAFWTLKRLVKWVVMPFSCWLLVFCVSNRTELAETYERLKCGGDACPVLSAEELRWRFIKSYLHYMLNERTQLSKAKVDDQLVLLPVELNAQRLVNEIEEGTLLSTVTNHALPLKTHEDIDALTPVLLVKHPSFAWVSLPHRRAIVSLMQNIQPARLKDVYVDIGYTKEFLTEEVARRIGRWERFRGYGKYFFEVDQGRYVDLSCCDGMPVRSDQESLSERKKINIEHLLKFQYDKSRSVLAASDRGNLLIFEDERAMNSGALTSIIFYTKSTFKE